mmetsp:Transcript_113570/g.326465  ORF Transcript_113570/g.326465 Transcript_113570/m.326465 type:complete len:481 (+) Transcript_113570:1874-3316(+)
MAARELGQPGNRHLELLVGHTGLVARSLPFGLARRDRIGRFLQNHHVLIFRLCAACVGKCLARCLPQVLELLELSRGVDFFHLFQHLFALHGLPNPVLSISAALPLDLLQLARAVDVVAQRRSGSSTGLVAHLGRLATYKRATGQGFGLRRIRSDQLLMRELLELGLPLFEGGARPIRDEAQRVQRESVLRDTDPTLVRQADRGDIVRTGQMRDKLMLRRLVRRQEICAEGTALLLGPFGDGHPTCWADRHPQNHQRPVVADFAKTQYWSDLITQESRSEVLQHLCAGVHTLLDDDVRPLDLPDPAREHQPRLSTVSRQGVQFVHHGLVRLIQGPSLERHNVLDFVTILVAQAHVQVYRNSDSLWFRSTECRIIGCQVVEPEGQRDHDILGIPTSRTLDNRRTRRAQRRNRRACWPPEFRRLRTQRAKSFINARLPPWRSVAMQDHGYGHRQHGRTEELPVIAADRDAPQSQVFAFVHLV